MRRRWKIIVLVWAAALLMLPLGLAWTGEGTAPEAENRSAAEFPDPPRPQDAEWFGGVTGWLEDRLALSGRATRLLTRFDLEVSGRLPAGEVIVGDDGFLFLRKSLDSPCLDAVGLDRERELLEQVRDAATARGMRLVLAVVPDKLAVEVERVPTAFRDAAGCLHARAVASHGLAHELLGDAALPMVELLDTEPSSYFPDDTHWNASGRLAAMQALVTVLEPGMWDDEAVEVVEGERDKDLLALAGIPETHRVSALDVRFGRAERREPLPGLDRGVAATGRPRDGRQLVSAPTLMLHDSFVASWRHEFAALFADVRLVHWDDLGRPALAEALQGRDTLVVELVGRSYWGDSARLEGLLELLSDGG